VWWRRKKVDEHHHHHERLKAIVKKLEKRVTALEKHRHRSDEGVFTDQPWLPLDDTAE
jgi:hypothetical protein